MHGMGVQNERRRGNFLKFGAGVGADTNGFGSATLSTTVQGVMLLPDA
jgi:hypothetical protein